MKWGSCMMVTVAWLCGAPLTMALLTHLDHPVHAFYYLWYGNLQHDGTYKHWNHEVLPHWEQRINERYPEIGQRFQPPHALHSPFYPLQGPYSSTHKETIWKHFEDLVAAKVQVLVVSWWGRRDQAYATDTQGVNTDLAVEQLLQYAEEFNNQNHHHDKDDIKQGKIFIAFHLEPYPSRSADSIRTDVEYLVENYGKRFNCLYRLPSPYTKSEINQQEKKLVYYVYDSYHIQKYEWERLLKEEGDISIRNTEYDGIFIGLWLQSQDGRELLTGGFNGIYTYFASEGFSYGSTTRMWKSMCEFARSHSMYCILSVGPGYDDSLIRPWNAFNTKERKDGNYYRDMWTKAIKAEPDFIR